MLISFTAKTMWQSCTSVCLRSGCSAGLVNGRNVWRADLTEKYAQIKDIVGKRELWVASSCSLLHSPIDLSVETRLDPEVKSWFAFALQSVRSWLCCATR